jgi:putative membrane fusion protein
MPKPSEAQIKVRVRRNPVKALRNLSLILVSAYVVFITYGFIRDIIIDRLAEAQQLQPGIIQVKVPAQGILIRDEVVVNAPRNGILRVIAHEGERVRVGAVLAQVVVASLDSKTGETIFNIVAPEAGIVSYFVDGLENVYSPKNLTELDFNKIDTIKSEPRIIMPGSQVEEGKPVCKIVNNLVPMKILAVTGEVLKFPDKPQRNKVELTLSNNDQQVYQALLMEKAFRGNANQILFNVDNYDEHLMVVRKQELIVTTARYEGYIIPTGALVRKDGKDGIFTIFKERIQWKNVEIEGIYQEKAVISGITPDIIVIIHPEYVYEGRPFR